jgi:hypothetical protein
MVDSIGSTAESRMCGIQSAERPVKGGCGALAVGAKMTVSVPKAIALLQGLTPLSRSIRGPIHIC